jgi:hypothetical protein
MLAYKLKGKHVILQLDPDFLPFLAFSGIEGSPLFAKVHSKEETGLWLQTDHFVMCPAGIPKLYDAFGEAHCRAHIFIPEKAILSIVAFPADVPNPTKDLSVHRIGFKPARKTRK